LGAGRGGTFLGGGPISPRGRGTLENFHGGGPGGARRGACKVAAGPPFALGKAETFFFPWFTTQACSIFVLGASTILWAFFLGSRDKGRLPAPFWGHVRHSGKGGQKTSGRKSGFFVGKTGWLGYGGRNPQGGRGRAAFGKKRGGANQRPRAKEKKKLPGPRVSRRAVREKPDNGGQGGGNILVGAEWVVPHTVSKNQGVPSNLGGGGTGDQRGGGPGAVSEKEDTGPPSFGGGSYFHPGKSPPIAPSHGNSWPNKLRNLSPFRKGVARPSSLTAGRRGGARKGPTPRRATRGLEGGWGRRILPREARRTAPAGGTALG